MIPKIIHQIWVGDEPPEFVKNAMQSVRDLHPDYEYILHGNECIEKYNLQHLFNVVPHSFISDVIRINELQKTGGWYIDADIIALQSINNLSNEIHNSEISCGEISKGDGLGSCCAFFGVTKEYDLSDIIKSYNGKTPLPCTWQHFIKDYTPVPIELYGKGGTILDDLLMNSWGKQYRELVENRVLQTL